VPAGYSKYNAYFMTGTVEKVRQYMDALFKRGVKEYGRGLFNSRLNNWQPAQEGR
jgi:hypothetical protein